MGMFNKGPRTVSQITGNLQKIVDELEQSEEQYQYRMSVIAEEKARLDAENRDIGAEIARNNTVAGKLKDLLGY